MAASIRPRAPRTRRLACLSSHRDRSVNRLSGPGARRVCPPLVILCAAASLLVGGASPCAHADPTKGVASWYGEEHRGKLMANGKRFNPDKFTAASWFYPLGTKVLVTVNPQSQPRRSVVVTITDRGPAKDLVRDGRIIDLSHAPFRRLASPELGLVPVSVHPLR